MLPLDPCRGADRWFSGYVRSVLRRRQTAGPRHILFCIADHFEPFGKSISSDGRISGGRPVEEARNDVRAWCEAYRGITGGFRDADGCRPRHTFFYPWDEYDAGVLDILADSCRHGFGEVEVQFHHRGDTAEHLKQSLNDCRDTYNRQHGLLGAMEDGTIRYGFVHGNWALCNARPDGDWCGVNRELEILSATGCYADFTFPSAPSPTQPRVVNSVYYGVDPVKGARGHRFLRFAQAGVTQPPDSSMLFIPGPLGLNWHSRRFHLLPRLENAEISVALPLSMQRLALWLRLDIHVRGRPDWIVVKLHTHGMSPRSRDAVTGVAMARFHRELKDYCADSLNRVTLHYVSARELYNIVCAAEAGEAGDPGIYRDYAVGSPPGAMA